MREHSVNSITFRSPTSNAMLPARTGERLLPKVCVSSLFPFLMVCLVLWFGSPHGTPDDICFSNGAEPLFRLPFSSVQQATVNKNELLLELAVDEVTNPEVCARRPEWTGMHQRGTAHPNLSFPTQDDTLTQLRFYLPGKDGTEKSKAEVCCGGFCCLGFHWYFCDPHRREE